MFKFIKTTVVCERYGDADWCELQLDSQFKAVAQNKNENEHSTICTQIQMAFGVLYSVHKITQTAHILRMLHRAEYTRQKKHNNVHGIAFQRSIATVSAVGSVFCSY